MITSSLCGYLLRFTGENPFGHSAIDIRGFAMGVLGTNFEGARRANLPKHLLSEKPHVHTALEDALEQGELFCNLLAERANLSK